MRGFRCDWCGRRIDRAGNGTPVEVRARGDDDPGARVCEACYADVSADPGVPVAGEFRADPHHVIVLPAECADPDHSAYRADAG